MRPPFSRTLAFIESDQRGSARVVAVIATMLLALWIAWLVCARTTIHAVSDEGRLLAAGAASPIQAPVAGVVAENKLTLEQEVHAGDVLVVLDASVEKLRLAEEETRVRGLEQAVVSVETIIEAEHALARANARSGATRVASASARAQTAAEIAKITKQQDEAMKRLRDASLATGLEALKSAEDLQRQRAQLVISGAEAASASADLDRVRKETNVRLLGLQRELVELRGKIAGSRSVSAQLEWDIARRTLRAPVDGVVADVAALPKGAAVAPTTVLGTIIPRAKLRWVAYFPPRDAVGRIKTGQKARIHLDAFPWTAYGALDATVVSVGSEPRDQRVRVELDVVDAGAIPLSHGMTGSADVETEVVSPLRLLLRLIGRSIRATPPPAPRPAGSSIALGAEPR